ncbi:hypothetical protein ACT3SZ_00900 [Corynebacterium sp. AOP40-9SA-29]|uniref:hypothetical protein n=1 Tax=Corynebacterium sp. AOP40-9SA-29 TaxID=3457677 RepID=UPI0040334385
MSAPFVTTDNRGRVSLGPGHGDETFIIEETAAGSVILTPAKVVSKLDEYIVSNPRIMAALAEEPTPENTVPRRHRGKQGRRS